MGFSDETMGSVFEGEKRFDMVLRLQKDSRQDISDLRNLFVDTPSCEKIPLSELAEITYQKGAAKISRDNTQRRIVVGVNVRGSDLQTVVDKIKTIVDSKVHLPPGYNITYGGQFENLQSATARLKIAVPIALVLIFILLYFAFSFIREALMVFSAIPLAAVGGILFLWLRGMPFSISAGVGFIGLFGIAVLNGIVLIEHFKELRYKGMKNDDELTVSGAQDRLRAVLLTASAAALGSLPMAVSSGAGAEVQRPLATVVIGGLITSTLLTLIVLPVIYSLFNKEKKDKDKSNDNLRIKALSIVILLIGFSGYSQETQVKTIKNVDELKAMALENNLGIKASALRVEESRASIGSAFTFDRTEGYFGNDASNRAAPVGQSGIGDGLHVLGIRQLFNFPTVYFARAKVNRAMYGQQASQFEIDKRNLEQSVAQVYYELQYQQAQVEVYRQLDSLYQQFAHAAKRRFELGETNYLEKITAQAKQKQLETLYKQAQDQIAVWFEKLRPLIKTDQKIVIVPAPLQKLELTNPGIQNNPGLDFYKNRSKVFAAQFGLEKQQLLPDISLTYFQWDNNAIKTPLKGYQVGIHIPVLFFGNSSKIKAANIAKRAAEQESADYKVRLNSEYYQLIQQMIKYKRRYRTMKMKGKAFPKRSLRPQH